MVTMPQTSRLTKLDNCSRRTSGIDIAGFSMEHEVFPRLGHVQRVLTVTFEIRRVCRAEAITLLRNGRPALKLRDLFTSLSLSFQQVVGRAQHSPYPLSRFSSGDSRRVRYPFCHIVASAVACTAALS